MKKVLFCINTLSKAGAETALLELLRRMKDADCRIDLYVITGMGELSNRLPGYVTLLNQNYSTESVLGAAGRRKLTGRVLKAFFRHGNGLRLLPYLVKNTIRMLREGNLRKDKLSFRLLAQSGEKNETEYDLAVAFLEGGSAYYVADRVKAKRKLAFVHVDYALAGYCRELDLGCYDAFDRIYAVSEEVKKSFLAVYPEYERKTDIFENLFSGDSVREQSLADGGFTDDFDGKRILTVARLVPQKALEVSAEACSLLKEAGISCRWYVLGEGESRGRLERRIHELGLEQNFVLLGQKDNPYPYMRQADLCVQASAFEGKSIAVREEMSLGRCVLVSDTSGNRELVKNLENGLVCDFTSQAIYEKIKHILFEEELRTALGAAAAQTMVPEENWYEKLFG